MTYEQKIQWCIDQHKNTNHWYDKYLPYEFHLRMVVQVAKDFNYLAKEYLGIYVLAAWGHDLIEDTRTSYNDVKEILGSEVADIIYALTNEKGKNRSERANHLYYQGIRETPGAVFVKLCDRIANVQYSKMTKSRMFEMYKNENQLFVTRLDPTLNPELAPLFEYLNNLFI